MSHLRFLVECLRGNLDEAEGKRPPKKQIEALIQAYAKLLYAGKIAPGMKDQQRMYDAFWDKYQQMSTKYPHVDMTSRDFWDALRRKAEAWTATQAFKGPGVWW